jgi:hypothetical protein
MWCRSILWINIAISASITSTFFIRIESHSQTSMKYAAKLLLPLTIAEDRVAIRIDIRATCRSRLHTVFFISLSPCCGLPQFILLRMLRQYFLSLPGARTSPSTLPAPSSSRRCTRTYGLLLSAFRHRVL